jgi:myo-inositol-1(or 4)-monophosphatase
MIENKRKIKSVAIEAVSLVSEKLKREYAKFDRQKINLKSKHEILTKCDLMSEKIIINTIKKNFPEHRILSEEKGDNKKKNDYLWLIDPIDGTTNFSIHNPLWSITLGLSYKNEIIFGIILAPMLNELYIAEKGKGAFLNSKKIKIKKNNKNKIINTFCHGNKESDIKKAIKYYSYQKLNNLDCRQLGSAAIELAYVASSRIDSILIPGANSWDIAAGTLLVKEAGGKVSDFKGKKWNLKNKNILASNKDVHNDILKILEKLRIQ